MTRAHPRIALLIALVALTLTLFEVNAASAQTFLITAPGHTVTATSLGKLTFQSGEWQLICNVTLGGTLEGEGTEQEEEAFIELAPGVRLGRIGELRSSECTESFGTEAGIESALGLPWSLNYNSVLGTLPNRLIGLLSRISSMALRISIFRGLLRCLFMGNPGLLTTLSGANPYAVGLPLMLTIALSLIEGASCPSEITARGSLRFTPAQEVIVAEPPIVFTMVPAEASERGARIEFGRIRPEETKTITLELTPVRGAARLNCAMLAGSVEFSFDAEARSACGRFFRQGGRKGKVKLILDPRGARGRFARTFQLRTGAVRIADIALSGES